MRLIPRDSLVATPWKNGGGVTRQIACFPDGSDLTSFDWRLSTAEVAQDGGFSRFEGVDRRLHILDGAGLDLRFGTESPRRLLRGEHIDFPGEAAVHGSLVDGAIADLNVMVRRERWRMEVAQLAVDGPRVLGLTWETAAIFVLGGTMRVEGLTSTATRFDTILCEDGNRTPTVAGQAELLLIGFNRAGRGP